MMKKKFEEEVTVLSQEVLADGIYSLWLETKEIAGSARPGQFLSLYTKDASRLLPRPISICEIDKEKNRLRIVYRVVGKGTEEFSMMQPGEVRKAVGPLGNGFPLEEGFQRVFLIGGGIGIPPMLELAKQLPGERVAVLGFRDELFLTEDFERAATKLYYATEDGSAGSKGNVLDAIRENALEADAIFACGPTPMLRALKAYALEKNIPCYISMEEKMACGIGACLGCVCKSKEKDEHSQVKNKRVCADGPVFEAREVEI